MAKFKFSLETLLRVRKREEELAEREFGEANRKVQTQREKIQKKDKEIEEARLLVNQGNQLDPEYMSSLFSWLKHQKSERQKMLEILTALKKHLEEKRRNLLEKQKARKAIEILREKKLEEFKEEQKKKEQAFADEMAVIRHFRAEQTREQE